MFGSPVASLCARLQDGSRRRSGPIYIACMSAVRQQGQTWVVAHELAHAFRAAKLNQNWFHKMGGDNPNAYRYGLEERLADEIAAKWGFAKEIRAMRRERQTVVNPYPSAHDVQILHRIQNRTLPDLF